MVSSAPEALTDPKPPVSRTSIFVGAGAPAKNLTRSLAPAAPVFAGTPAPTECASRSRNQLFFSACIGSKTSIQTIVRRSQRQPSYLATACRLLRLKSGRAFADEAVERG